MTTEQVVPYQNKLDIDRLLVNHLTIIRVICGSFIFGLFILFISALVIGYTQLQQPCTTGFCHPVQLSPEEARYNAQLDLSLNFYAIYTTISYLIFGGVGFIVGGMIFWHRVDSWISIYVALMLIAFGVSAVPVLSSLYPYIPHFNIFHQTLTLFGVWSLPVILYIFPSGRFMPSWTKWLLLLWLLNNLYLISKNGIPNTGILSGPPSVLGQIVLVVGGLSQIYRYFHSPSSIQKQQTKWAIFGFVGHMTCLFLLIQVLHYFPELTSDTIEQFIYRKYAFAFIGLVPILFIPLSLAICVLRYHLWDINIIINRTLVYTLLTGIVIVLYTAIVSSLGMLFHSPSNSVLSLMATGIIAVSFHPVRDRIQRLINHLMFGHRHEPYMVLQRLSQQLEPVMAVNDVLPTIAQTIAQALRLPYVAIALAYEGKYQVVAEYGSHIESIDNLPYTTLPLVYQSVTIGQLQLTTQGRGDMLSPTDLNLLEMIARQTSIAAYNVRLTIDLQRSREELITTREEERRRLRRDLHDGLGPVLAAMSFQLDAVYNLMDDDIDKAKSVTTDLKARVQTSLSEIRRIAYNLRPPALDDLGLIGALNEYLTVLGDNDKLHIMFFAPRYPIKFTAAVEVAAYRIILEAVTNVQRHANATMCSVSLGLSENILDIAIIDNGCGIASHHSAGVGLTTMRERASELGGKLAITNYTKGGTLIHAVLPLMYK